MDLGTIVRMILIAITIIICISQVITLVYNMFTSRAWEMTTRYRYEQQMILPDITICNSNPINATLANEIGINNKDLTELIQNTKLGKQWADYANLFKGAVSLTDLMFQAIMSGIKFDSSGIIPLAGLRAFGVETTELQLFASNLYETYYNRSGIKFTDLARGLAHTCGASVSNCYTGARLHGWDCCKDSKLVFTDRGVCVQLNVKFNLQQAAGQDGGYHMLYEQHTDNHISSVIDVSLESGITIEFRYGNNGSTQVTVPANSQASIKLDLIEEKVIEPGGFDFSFFPPPCRKDDATDDNAASALNDVNNCQRNCNQRMIYSMCKCQMAVSLNKTSICEAHQAIHCKVMVYAGERVLAYLKHPGIPTNKMKEIKAEHSTCWQSCIKPCNRVYVKARVTTPRLGRPKQKKKVAMFLSHLYGTNISTEYVEQNFIYLDIYFDNFVTQENIMNSVANFNQLMSLLGGQLGFWIGASMVTLIDLVPYIFSGIGGMGYRQGAEKIKSKKRGQEY